VGNNPCKKLLLKTLFKEWQKSVSYLNVKSVDFSGLRRRTACLMSESQIEETFKKSEKVKQALFGITTEVWELKPDGKCSAKASIIIIIMIIIIWGVKYGRCVGLTTLPPSMSRLSRQ
jgi:hypothetical protein